MELAQEQQQLYVLPVCVLGFPELHRWSDGEPVLEATICAHGKADGARPLRC